MSDYNYSRGKKDVELQSARNSLESGFARAASNLDTFVERSRRMMEVRRDLANKTPDTNLLRLRIKLWLGNGLI